MKLLVVAVLSLVLNHAPATFLVVDRYLKKPARYASDFTTELYLKRNFPVYASEKEELIDAIDSAVKKLDKGLPCNGLEKAGTAHTTILLEAHCHEEKTFRITLVTQVDETNMSFSFALVSNELGVQNAQRKLLDLAGYISR